MPRFQPGTARPDRSGGGGTGATITGTVYDPPVPYDAKACKLTTLQDGNKAAGTICGRDFSTTL